MTKKQLQAALDVEMEIMNQLGELYKKGSVPYAHFSPTYDMIACRIRALETALGAEGSG